jgi:hypothetical protein
MKRRAAAKALTIARNDKLAKIASRFGSKIEEII